MSEAIEILKSCDAFLEGHFLLSSGRHSSAYCQMAYLQQYQPSGHHRPEPCSRDPFHGRAARYGSDRSRS